MHIKWLERVVMAPSKKKRGGGGHLQKEETLSCRVQGQENQRSHAMQTFRIVRGRLLYKWNAYL